MIEWLRIAAKNGWLGPTPTAKHVGERRFKVPAEKIAVKFAKMRVRMGLIQPYGPKAAKLGFGKATLPSQRPRSTPKNKPLLALPGP